MAAHKGALVILAERPERVPADGVSTCDTTFLVGNSTGGTARGALRLRDADLGGVRVATALGD